MQLTTQQKDTILKALEVSKHSAIAHGYKTIQKDIEIAIAILTEK